MSFISIIISSDLFTKTKNLLRRTAFSYIISQDMVILIFAFYLLVHGFPRSLQYATQ